MPTDSLFLQYTIEAEKAGKYSITLRVSHSETGGELFLTLNGQATEKRQIPVGKDNIFTNIRLEKLSFKKGKNILRIYIEKGGFKLQNITLAT
ncbi:MAG: hypothetical protein LBG77_04225 [Dysgonamonadaceae bacterium]|jgi:hypothetical protein|nr:hypothetical protein [Dysgonamonadaceae bacterium]